MTERPIDWAASPTLSRIREVAGDAAAVALVAARGGTEVWIPQRPDESCDLVRIVGAAAARAIADAFGSGPLRVPTGRGLAHGRRIDPQAVATLTAAGASLNGIARRLHCTARQVSNIRRRLAGLEADEQKGRQGRLF